MKKDIVARWVRGQTKDGATKVHCAKRMEVLCGGVFRSQELNAMENGKRLNRCKRFVMLNDTLHDILTEYGYKRQRPLSSEDWREFINSLLEPERKK